MFTGIIEALGEVISINKKGLNIDLEIKTPFHEDVYIDQSIAHNGVCLTIVEVKDSTYIVTAIYETLIKSNLNLLKIGDIINLERAMITGSRLDGHFVQGHVDSTTICESIADKDGSYYFTFSLPKKWSAFVVDKGSVCINGTSLTAILNPTNLFSFKVAIIPFTFENTNFKSIQKGDLVNIEFDILGKYILRKLELIS